MNRKEMPDENHFQNSFLEYLWALVDQGKFNDGRPEDAVVAKLKDTSLDDLSYDEYLLFEERVRPLVEEWHYRWQTFEDEYLTRRSPGYYDVKDHNQGDLFSD